MGHPGLDPGTLRFEPDSTCEFAVVRVSWSETSVGPPTSLRICFPGYRIGYTTSEVGCLSSFIYALLMTSKLSFLSRSKLEAVVTESRHMSRP